MQRLYDWRLRASGGPESAAAPRPSSRSRRAVGVTYGRSRNAQRLGATADDGHEEVFNTSQGEVQAVEEDDAKVHT
jgi:hypothetical protein